MMRFFVVVTFFISFGFSSSIVVESKFTDMFNAYPNLKKIKSKGSLFSFRMLKNAKVDFAVVRGDILFFANQGVERFKFKDYSLVSKLKEKSFLYLVSKEGLQFDKVTDLRGKIVSIGSVEDMSNLYLRKALMSIEGVIFNVHFKAYDVETSLGKINEGKVDVLFAFANEDFKNKVEKRGLILHVLPRRLSTLLSQNRGFNLLNKNKITVDNYLISSMDINKEKLVPFVKEIEEGNMLKVIKDEFGMINPLLSVIKIEMDAEVVLNQADKEKMATVKSLVLEIKSLKKDTDKKIKAISNKVKIIKVKANNFKMPSVQLDYKNQAEDILDDIDSEKMKIKRKYLKLKILNQDKNVVALQVLLSELDLSIENLEGYVKAAKKIIRLMEAELLREKEAEEKILEEDAKKILLEEEKPSS